MVIALGSGAYAMSRAGDDPEEGQPAAAVGSAEVDSGPNVLPEEGTVLTELDRTVADGVFVVTVTSVRCGVGDVGWDELSHPAKGEFCLFKVAVKNAGKEPRLLDAGIQRAIDAHGTTFRADEQAVSMLNGPGLDGPSPDGQTSSLLEEIAPGTTVRGVLPFDVPPGTKLAALVLHESVQSRGARVTLT